MQDTQKLVESRGSSYGHPRDNFRRIADGLTWFFRGTDREITVTPEDVPTIMVITKLARDMNKRLSDSINEDDWNDIAGYARTRLMLEDAKGGGLEAAVIPPADDAGSVNRHAIDAFRRHPSPEHVTDLAG